VGLEPGTFGYHNRINIQHAPTPLRHQSYHFLQQFKAIGPLPTAVFRWEMATDVPEGKGPKQGIHQGMDQDIRIAVAIEPKPLGMLQPDAPEDQGTTLDQAMDVIAVANPQIHGCSLGSHRLRPVFQACWPFGSAPLQPANIEVGATQTGALLALLLAPSFNGAMIATA
jgi:hypothetical protein